MRRCIECFLVFTFKCLIYMPLKGHSTSPAPSVRLLPKSIQFKAFNSNPDNRHLVRCTSNKHSN